MDTDETLGMRALDWFMRNVAPWLMMVLMATVLVGLANGLIKSCGEG